MTPAESHEHRNVHTSLQEIRPQKNTNFFVSNSVINAMDIYFWIKQNHLVSFSVSQPDVDRHQTCIAIFDFCTHVECVQLFHFVTHGLFCVISLFLCDVFSLISAWGIRSCITIDVVSTQACTRGKPGWIRWIHKQVVSHLLESCAQKVLAVGCTLRRFNIT